MKLVVVASMVLFGVLGTASADNGSRATGQPPAELVYVANADSGPVTVYPAGATGPIQPVGAINNPQNPQTTWDPWGVTFDAASNLYVQTFLSDATSFVFPPGASTPGRIFRVAGPDSEAIAVDRQGYEYVMGGEGPPVISVAAPGASGSPSNLYSVSPVRQIQTDQAGFVPWPSVLTVDDHNDVIAAVSRSTGNAIEVYQGGPIGPGQPLRTIAGPRTGLGGCAGSGACDHVSVTYSPYTGQIYAAVSTATGGHVSVFAGSANGDARPVRTIAGDRTGLTGKVVTGIAVSRRTGDIFVLVKSSQFQGPAAVEVFGRLASGNVSPLRSFTDASSGLADAQGIALADGPAPRQ